MDRDQYYWITDPVEEYVPVKRYGSSSQSDENNITFEVFNTGRLIRGNMKSIVGVIPPPGNVTLCTINEDLVENDDISEPSIMWSLKTRFFQDKIYSSIGSIIIALNPYKSIPSLYTKEVGELYRDSGLRDSSTTQPHIWRISHAAYVQLTTRKTRQAIVISGESGAGKTETTKKCLQYLSRIGSQSGRRPSLIATEIPIEDKVIGTNPLLESFGNSKTARNDNSSRFGKWLEINFTLDTTLDPRDKRAGHIQLTGASISQYLLEKSRVVFQSEGERNYHIFYQICSDPAFGLISANRYRYLNQSGCIVVDGIDDVSEWADTQASFHNLLFPVSDQASIFNSLKAILYLGNIEFGIASDGFSAMVSEGSDEWIELAAGMLEIESNRIKHCFLNRNFVTARDGVSFIQLTPVQSIDTRNAFAKEIYGRIFNQIVRHANLSLKPSSENLGRGQVQLCCGLLDIFGFELLQCNSFEQLCINYANEKLQQYFLQFVLKKEQELYEQEGIVVPRVVPRDNEDVLQLIEARTIGIFARLDEEVKIAKGSDAGFISKVEHDHNKKTAESRFFRDVKMTKSQFEIRHFAGVVRYESVGFLEKNKDKLYDHLEELLAESRNQTFKLIMYENAPNQLNAAKSPRHGDSSAPATSSGKASTTLSGRFQVQLSQLIEILNASDAHFVRCIKPNSHKNPNEIESSLVLRQLQYSGVLEAIMIRKNGFPTRRSLAEFRRAYWMLSGYSRHELATENDYIKCQKIVEGLISKNAIYKDHIHVGRSIVFFRPEILQALEQERLARGVAGVIFIQSKFRKQKAIERVIALKNARAELRDLLSQGLLRNSSNTDILPQLKEKTKQYQVQLRLCSVEIKKANMLIKRLDEVSNCKHQATRLLSSTSSEHYKDVLFEYQAVKACIAKVVELGFEYENIAELQSREAVLMERGEALLKLRSAIENNDDDALRETLSVVSKLNAQFGIFCADDEEHAKSTLHSISTEIQVFSGVIPIINGFHYQYMERVKKGGGENFDEIMQDWIESNVPPVNKRILDVMQPFFLKTPTAVLSINMFDICKSIVSLQEFWVLKNWTAVAASVETMLGLSKGILEYSKQTSVRLINISKQLIESLQVEIGFVREELDRHVVMPTISESLDIGRISEDEDGNINLDSVDCESIENTVDHVNSLEWVGMKVKSLLLRIQVLINARRAVIEGRWDDALSCCESLAEMKQRKIRLGQICTEFMKLSASKDEDNSEDQGVAKVEAMTSHTNGESAAVIASQVMEDSAGGIEYVGAMLVESTKIASELKLIARVALEYYVQTIFLAAVQFGRVVSSGIDISGNMDRVSTVSLTCSVKEAKYLMENHSTGKTVKFSCMSSVQLLEETRQCALQQDWKAIVALMKSRTALELLAFDFHEAYRIPAIRAQFYNSVKEELQKILLYAKNRDALNGLIVSISSTGIRGTTGDVNVENCEITELEAAIAKTEECNNGEVSGLLVEVLTMLNFCTALSLMRKAFVSKIDTQKTQDYANELQELAASCTTSIPNNVKEEITLAQNHLLYCRARELLRDGLKVRPPVQYLIPTGSVSSPVLPAVRSNRSGSGVSFSLQENENKTILDEEDLKLNFDVLKIDLLRDGETMANKLREVVDIATLPEEFSLLLQCGTSIKNLRQSVLNYDWEEASRILDKIKSSGLPEKLPLIAEEIIGGEQPVNNFLVIAECKLALASGFVTGPTGFMDVSSIAMDKLDKAIATCQRTGCKTSRTEALFKAVLVVSDIRRAQSVFDWGSLKAALRRADAENLGIGVTAVCAQELQRAILERDNYELVSAMTRGILQEEILAVDGLIEISKISTDKLAAALVQVNNTNLTRKGEITVSCSQLSETVVKFRRAVQLQSFTVQSLFEQLRQDVEMLKTSIEIAESSSRARVSKSMRSPMGRPARKTSILSPNIQDFQMSPSFSVSKPSVLWDFYNDTFDCIEREIMTVQHYLELCELETEVTKALQENGVTAEMIGQSEWSKVRLDELRIVIQKKENLDSALKPIPANLNLLMKAAQLILEMRIAIIGNKWDALPSLLEEAVTGLTGQQREFCRAEILAIQHEQENRLIISIMSDALKQGRIEGTLGNIRLGGVSYEHLINAIASSKSLTPRTEEATAMILTAETILPLRKLLCEESIDWKIVKESVTGILAPTIASSLHASILPELRLIQATADDNILCNAMESALKTGGPTGEPGFLNLSNIHIEELAAACQTVIETAVKTDRAAQLWNACRYTKSLREALLKSATGDEQLTSEATKSIRSMINDIFEARKTNTNDAAWALCRDELMLITKDAHIGEIRESIEETIKKASKVYDNRSKMGLSQSGRKSISTNTVTEIQLPVEDLNKAIDQGEHMDFESDILYRYVKCAKTLRNLRTSLVAEEWEMLNSIVSDDKTRIALEIIPSALTELSMVKQESHNYQVVNIIEKALQPRPKEETDPQHSYLVKAIDIAQAAVVTSVTAKQLLECARNVLQLRLGISEQNSKEVGAALKWFRANPQRCPVSIQHEAQRAFIMHQNDLLLTGLTKALGEGAASGVRGNVDISTVDVSNLSKLLESAREVKHQTTAVHDLIEAGEVIYSLRCAMKKNDANGVNEALDQLATKKVIPDIILEEIALARAELENSITITALYDSLFSFDDANPRSLELSLVGTQQLVNITPTTNGDDSALPGDQAPPAIPRPKSARRRYSYENINSADIDPDTIDIGELDQALEIARTHGVLTDQARRLFRTTLLIRSLRSAMKLGDWPKVEETISESNFIKGIGDVYDIVASREIQVILSQLEMRKSIVDLSKALKVGWAHCSNGIVDTSTLSINELAGSIDRAEKSMEELGYTPISLSQSVDISKYENLSASMSRERPREHAWPLSMSSSTSLSSSLSSSRRPSTSNQQLGKKSATQSQVELLLSSAKIVLEVRELLMKKELEQAGILADEGIRSQVLHSSVQHELKLYANEINRALGMMKLCLSLREGMAKGDLETLEPLIFEARQASMQLSNDLGLVRTLEKAQCVYKSFLACRKALVKLSSNYNAADVQKTIDNAISIKISGYLMENAVKRLKRLNDFESSVLKVRQSYGGALTDDNAFKTVIELGNTFNMKHHPLTRRAEISLKLATSALRTSSLVEACARNVPFVAATETIRLKRAFLSQPSSKALFVLERFPRLRAAPDFYFRITNAPRPPAEKMLLHSDEEIYTSLTMQSPALAALSVLIFAQCIQGIERQMYTHVEVLLRNLIIVGRNCVTIRDEILLQIVKQIRQNMDEDGLYRLWSVLCACLFHFPPSHSFENFLELFLITEAEEVLKSVTPPQLKSPAAQVCIRYMHQSIFKYGYTRPIVSKCDLSLRCMSTWLNFSWQFDIEYHLRMATQSQVTSLAVSTAPTGANDGETNDLLSQIWPVVDHAFPFVDQYGILISRTPPTSISPQQIRGSRLNWIERFNQFLGNERFVQINRRESNGGVGLSTRIDDADTKSRMSLNTFVGALSYTSPTVDKTDRDLLQHLVFGRIPDQRAKIAREYFSDSTSFYYISDPESDISIQRREWLRQTLIDVMVPHPSSPPLKPAERRAMATEFWNTYIVPFYVEFDDKKTDSKKNSLIISKADAVAYMNWEMYRELLLTAMELFLESDHNRREQEKLSSNSIPSTLRKPTLTSKDSSTSSKQPFDGFEMFTMNRDTGLVEKLAIAPIANTEEFTDDPTWEQ